MLGLAMAASAQEPLPVPVTFEFSAVPLPVSEQQRQTLEHDIAAALADSAHKAHPYWSFTAAPVSDAPRLKVWLEYPDAVTIHMALLNANGREVKRWNGVLFDAAYQDQYPFPRGNNWLPAVRQKFERQVLQPNDQAIRQALKEEAAVGREFSLLDPPSTPGVRPRAVLGIDGEKYEELSECEFLLRFKAADGRVVIHSTGIGTAPFTPNNLRFQGIALQLERWQQGSIVDENLTQHLGDLSGLTLIDVYLKNERLPGSAPQ